jgi:acyl-CoA thioesterase FadM
MKNASVEFCYEIRRRDEEKLIAEGSTILACLDENRRPRTIPDKIRNAITSKNSLPMHN